MANRSDRGREQPAALSRASKPAKQNGSSSAETIRASGHDRANRPYTRLHPDKARQTFKDPLATRERSTQDIGSPNGGSGSRQKPTFAGVLGSKRSRRILAGVAPE